MSNTDSYEVRVPTWEMVLPFEPERAKDSERALLRAIWRMPNGRLASWALPMSMEVVRIIASDPEGASRFLIGNAEDVAELGLERIEAQL